MKPPISKEVVLPKCNEFVYKVVNKGNKNLADFKNSEFYQENSETKKQRKIFRIAEEDVEDVEVVEKPKA